MELTFQTIGTDGKCRTFRLRGRYAWALSELVKAGDSGCTPIAHPGPRWSAYVHKLRHEYGLAIETIHEGHKGPFPGHHARYVLRSQVRLLAPCGAAT